MTNLLWHSNAPWSTTGYGAQTALFTPLLAKHFDLGISAFYGLEGNQLQFNEDVKVYPGQGISYGNETIQGHALAHFGGELRDGIVLSLMDVWVLDPGIWRTMNVAAWCPVDHDPLPPLVRRFFAETQAVPIAMSEWGQERLAEFDPLYVPHGVDTSIYKPYDHAESREATGLPEDAFVVGMVAANKGQPARKAFPEALQAFAEFRKRHDDAVLYLHTEMLGKSEGVALNVLVESLQLPEGSVLFADQYRVQFEPFAPSLMAKVYSGLDVLLNPARGEGFGLTVLEAQACGTPAIVTDFSAMSEVCGAGWKVEWDREWSGQLSWQARPKVPDILESLEHAYRMPDGTREALSAQAVEHAAKYDADLVMDEHFLPALEAVQERFAAREPQEVAA